jgi:1-acyl-sn-glycerol-3-phosphate acyltransferase
MSRRSSRFIARLVRTVASVFYRLDRAGPSLPSGPVLLVVNHPNALLDPAVVWATAGREVRFLAKSTLFSRHVMAPLVRRTGAIPVYRRMDGGTDVARNAETFAAVAEVLDAGGCVCVFPEGLTHERGRLQPLRTGAARMALDALGRGVKVALVPVGLNFEQRTTFRSRATVLYGRPFDAGTLAELARQDPPAAVRALTDRIAAALRALVIEADPKADARLIARVDRLYTAARRAPVDPAARVQRRRVIARGIDRLRTEDPERLRALVRRLDAYDSRRRRFGLRDRDLDWSVQWRASLRFAARELLVGCVLLPLAALGVLLFGVPYLVTGSIARRFAEDLSTHASVEAIGGGAVYLIWMAALSVAVAQLTDWRVGTAAFLFLPFVALAALAAFEREAAVLRTVGSWLAVQRVPALARRRLARQRADIADVLEEVYRWLQRS